MISAINWRAQSLQQRPDVRYVDRAYRQLNAPVTSRSPRRSNALTTVVVFRALLLAPVLLVMDVAPVVAADNALHCDFTKVSDSSLSRMAASTNSAP